MSNRYDDPDWTVRLGAPRSPARPRDRLTIGVAFEDFEPALREAGIDPDSITEHEWLKFADAFLAGTHWDEVARYATDAIKAQRVLDQPRENRR
jgi:hypothetical protein